jgi:hypothetical protein
MFPLGGDDREPLFGPGATSGSPGVRDLLKADCAAGSREFAEL